jgi:sugar phosphate isomerase/epimerase
MPNEYDIRIGTLVGGLGNDPADYIRQILPYGFESFSITFWETTQNIDMQKLADSVRRALDGSNAVISSLAIFGNPLESNEKDLQTLKGWEQCIDAAHLFGADIVGGFTGRLRGKSITESIPRYQEVFSRLADKAGEKEVRIAFENCSMGGDWRTGDWNIAHNPDAWELMFDATPHANIGLEWEPCHQLVQLIDPLPQLREWVKKIIHVHGKDATVYWDTVKKHGVTGNKPFAHHRTPGFGDTNWIDVISELRLGGFKGSIDIEGWHDPVYKGDLEMTGQVRGLNYLKQCRADYIPNPS